MAGISSKAGGSLQNRFKFNDGTELQSSEFSDGSSLELYATNFRSLDPQIGRFWQIDPMADVTYEYAPFAYANNNPLTYNDPLGLLSDSSHPVELQEVKVQAKLKVPKTFLPYVNFVNNRPYSIASNKDWPLSFSRDRTNDLLDSWAMGLGAENRVYLPNHPMTKRLLNSDQVNRARVAFYKKFITDYKNGKSLVGQSIKTTSNFGIVGIFSAGFDLVEQFIGGMDIELVVDENNQNVLFIAKNTTGKTSAYYHLASDIERDPGKITPQGNLNQIYIWSEPIQNVMNSAETVQITDIWRDAHVIK